MRRKGYAFYLVVAVVLIGGGAFTYYNPDTLPKTTSDDDSTDKVCNKFKQAVYAYKGNVDRELGEANVTDASCDCVSNMTNLSNRYLVTSSVETTAGTRNAAGTIGITFRTFPMISQGPIIYPLTNATNTSRQTLESLQNQSRFTSCTL